MASTALGLHTPDEVKRRVMFALELVDPVTGRLAFEDMIVTAPGFAPPVRSASGRFVWIDVDPPTQRTVTVKATSKRRIFAPLEKAFAVPARDAGVTAADLVWRFALEPTGLYAPPAGMLAAAGTLIAAAADRTPLAGVAVTLQFRDASDASVLASNYVARTDDRGQFVAVAPALGGGGPMMLPPPDAAAGLVGWLAFTNALPETRYTPLLPLRKGRMLRLPQPLAWGDLLNGAPPAPP
jgi:hypothetical protein